MIEQERIRRRDILREALAKLSLEKRQQFVTWLLRDVRMRNALFGEATISMSPGGTDVIRWSATQAATALGDLGMNNTTGRPSGFVGGVDAPLALLSEVGGVTADDFAFASDLSTQAISVANTFQTLLFDTNNELSGWTHTLDTGVFGCTQTGIYLVMMGVNAEKSAGGTATAGIRALFNAVEVPSSYWAEDIVSNNATVHVDSSFFVDATTGQDLTTQLVGGNTNVSILPVPSAGSPTAVPSAHIAIVRFS